MNASKQRYLESSIKQDLDTRMVFIGGPRQVGKTTLARMIGAHYRNPMYFNWDDRRQKTVLLRQEWAPDTDMLILDELHKYPRWKSFIKGVWDTRRHDERIIVTGSSRLDVFRRGGDSLQGRYHYYRLHPFSACELEGIAHFSSVFPKEPPMPVFDRTSLSIDHLFTFGGFPEPVLSGSERTLKRWHKERFERVFREDIRESEPIRQLAQVELLGAILPERVASPLSIQSLSRDVEASPKTIKDWLELLCRNYFIFRVPPWHRRLDRALKKESKYYLWDWSEVPSEGARFENMVAGHLLKWCHYYEDIFGIDVGLFYVRDRQKREVDFLIAWEGRPWILVECKLTEDRSYSSLAYFGTALDVKSRYLVSLRSTSDYEDRRTSVRVIPAAKFLMGFC